MNVRLTHLPSISGTLQARNVLEQSLQHTTVEQWAFFWYTMSRTSDPSIVRSAIPQNLTLRIPQISGPGTQTSSSMPQKVSIKFWSVTNRIGRISERSPKSRVMSWRMNLAFASWKHRQRITRVSKMLFSHSLGASRSLLFYLSIHTDLGISRPVSLILKLILRARRLVVWLTVPFALNSPPTKQHQAVAHRIETPSCIPNGHYVLYTSRLGTHNNKMDCSALWPRCCIFVVFGVSHWTIFRGSVNIQ